MANNSFKPYFDFGPIGSRREKLKAFFESRRFFISFIICSTVFFLGFLSFSVYQIFSLRTEYSFKQFFPRSHTLLSEDQKIRQTFLLSDKPALVFVLHDESEDGWLKLENFKWIKTQSEKLNSLKNVKNVFSFQTLQNAMTQKKDLIIGSPFDYSPPQSWAKIAQSNSLITPQLLTSDFKTMILLVETTSTQSSVIEKIQQQVLAQLNHPTVSVSLGGSLAAQNKLTSLLSQELRLFLFLSVLIFCCAFFFLFSSPSALFLIVFTLIFTNAFHLAWMSLFHIPLNVLLSTLPVINSISVMSLIIHSLHLWTQKKFEKAANIYSAYQILKELFLPNLLGTLTTAIGFIALLGAQIPIIQQYAWIVAVSVLASWALAQWILLYAMSFFSLLTKPPQIRKWFDQPAYWNFFAVKFNRPIIYSILGLTLVGVFLFPRLNFDSQLYSDLPSADQVSQTNQWLDQFMGGTVSYELSLNSKQKEFWLNPQNLGQLRKIQKQIRSFDGVGGIYSISDLLPSRLPQQKAQISEILFLYSMSSEDPTRNFMNATGSRIRLAIKFKDLPSDRVQATQDQIRQVVQTTYPQVQIIAGGASVYGHQINQNVSKKLVFGFWESIILIGGLLVLTFKSLRWALVACLPNLIAPVLMIAGLALTRTPIKPSVALIFSISLGLAFNNTVYFLSRLKSLVKEKDLSFLPIKRALSLEGNPCLFETLVMLAGFSIFLVSQFDVNQVFGALMILSIALGFIGDMIFLPALLRLFPGLLLKKTKPLSVSTSKAAIWIGFGIFAFCPLGKSAADVSAGDILQKTQKQIQAADESSEIKMTIIEPNGEKKIRVAHLKIKNQNKKAWTLAKIDSPQDVQGMGLLSLIDSTSEQHWIYLPQSKQVRRVVGSQTQSGILGSELSAGDLNSEILKGAKSLLIKTEADHFLIEVLPAKKAQFTKAIVTITKNYLPQKVDYYLGTKLKKTVQFKNYVQIGSVWRPQSILIRNHLNKRGTELQVSHQKVNQGLTEKDFSQSALKDDI